MAKKVDATDITADAVKGGTAPEQANITITDNRDQTGGGGIDDSIIGAVAISGMAIAGQPSMLSNLAYANILSSNDLGAKNQVSNQDAQNKLRISILSRAVNRVQNLQPLQARSAVDVLTNNELAQTITDLKATMAAFAGKRREARPGQR
jgi:hypothetical protein